MKALKADPIIDHPERQPPFQRAFFTILTMVAWTIWVSLWLPLITLIAWLLGLQDIYVKLGLDHPFQAANDFGTVLQVACIAALSLGGWAFYNRMRFAGKQKRRANRFVDIVEMAPALDASLTTAQRLRASRRSVVHFDSAGGLFLGVEES
jgi:biofilm PGA synthesis protein PgaD